MPRYFKPQSEISVIDLWTIKVCFPELFHIRYLSNDPLLPVCYIGQYSHNYFNMTQEEYEELETHWVSAAPCQVTEKVYLHTYKIAPERGEFIPIHEAEISKHFTREELQDIFSPRMSFPIHW